MMVKLNLYIFDILLSFMRICWLIVTIIYLNRKDDFPVLFLISTLEFQEKKNSIFCPTVPSFRLCAWLYLGRRKNISTCKVLLSA